MRGPARWYRTEQFGLFGATAHPVDGAATGDQDWAGEDGVERGTASVRVSMPLKAFSSPELRLLVHRSIWSNSDSQRSSTVGSASVETCSRAARP